MQEPPACAAGQPLFLICCGTLTNGTPGAPARPYHLVYWCGAFGSLPLPSPLAALFDSLGGLYGARVPWVPAVCSAATAARGGDEGAGRPLFSLDRVLRLSVHCYAVSGEGAGYCRAVDDNGGGTVSPLCLCSLFLAAAFWDVSFGPWRALPCM